MILILDAYNVIHKIRELEAALDRDLRSARDLLSERCRELLRRRGDIPKIILVFDGKSEYRDLDPADFGGVYSVFSETGETADERIVKILEGFGDRRRACVVSDDNYVTNHARAYGADVMNTSSFNRLLYRKKKSPLPDVLNDRTPGLPPGAAQQITDEYRRKLGL